MSGLDQPLVIANSCYHIGHERSVRVAEERGFFKEEGLDRRDHQRGGLIPAGCEFDGLAQQMWERGVDIATAVNVRPAIVQRARGEDVYIVGGWRIQLSPKLIGARGITSPTQLRGTRGVTREKWGQVHQGIMAALRTFGVGPDDIEWIEGIRDPVADNQGTELLRSGRIGLLPIEAGQEMTQLLAEGYPLVLDLEEFYRGWVAWPPGSVIVATKQTIDERPDELRAFLRANLRGYWFVQDRSNHTYNYELETRMRAATFNQYERNLRMLNSATPRPPRQGSRSMGEMVLDGLVPRPALARIIDEMVQFGEIPGPIDIDDVLKDAASIDACEQLLSRGLIDREKLQRWRAVLS